VSALQKLSSDAAENAKGLSGLKPTLAGSAASNDALATGTDGEDAEAEEAQGAWDSDAWDSDGIVLVVLAALALAALAYGLWRLFVAKPKRDEEEAELPSIDERYAQGVTF